MTVIFKTSLDIPSSNILRPLISIDSDPRFVPTLMLQTFLITKPNQPVITPL